LRNIFDQYSQAENRLTHALVSALGEDAILLRKFVKWATGAAPRKNLHIVEQQLPGEYEMSEDDYEQAGLPDAWIHDDDEWSLLVESKVAATLSLDQLKRHYRTAQKRGFSEVTVLAIDISNPKGKLPDYVIFRTWREIYGWLSDQAVWSEWAVRTLRYMEVAERKWAASGYLKEGTLTEFSGIHFDDDNPYNYHEAKRLIRLIMDELRQHPDLSGFINSRVSGRGAITGKGGEAVWDYVRFRGLDQKLEHTKVPHLSLVIDRREIRVFINAPNSMQGRFRRPVVDLGEDDFFEVMSHVNKNLLRVARDVTGAYPYASMTQRRFASQRAKASVDGAMSFDLRTAFPGGKMQKIKVQDQWLRALYSLITEKNSNLGWAVGMAFPYDKCAKTRKPIILDALANSWLACRPLLDEMLKK
jgi:hypothetical protein